MVPARSSFAAALSSGRATLDIGMPRYGKWDQLRTFLYPARAVLDLQVALESGPFRPVRYQFHSREDVVPVFARDGTEPISCNPHASSVPPQDGKESRDSRMLPRTASTAAEGRGGRVRGRGRATPASDQNRISRLGHWDMVWTVLNPNGLTTMFGSSETIPGVVTPPVKLPKQLT